MAHVKLTRRPHVSREFSGRGINSSEDDMERKPDYVVNVYSDGVPELAINTATWSAKLMAEANKDDISSENPEYVVPYRIRVYLNPQVAHGN